MRFKVVLGVTLVVSGFLATALAQEYPRRPVRLIAASTPGSGPDLLARLVRANDARIPGLLERQETGASHPWRGALRDEHGVHAAGGAAGLVAALVAALAAPGSRCRSSPELAERLALAGAPSSPSSTRTAPSTCPRRTPLPARHRVRHLVPGRVKHR